MEKPPEYLTDKSEYDEDQGLTKLLRRCKENPTLPVGEHSKVFWPNHLIVCTLLYPNVFFFFQDLQHL